MIALYIIRWGYLKVICLLLIVIVLFVKGSKQDSIVATPKEHNPFQKHMISSQYITITDYEAKVGYVLSPNYPLPHPINSSSIVALVAYHDANIDSIRLTFEHLNLQTSNFCESEAVEILLGESLYRNTSSNKARKIYTFCGTFKPRPLLVPAKSLFIHLVSDSFNTGTNRGFKMKFEFLNSSTELYNGCDHPDHFRCRNRNCIHNSLKCNRYDDCGDASDEDKLTPCYELPTISYNIDYKCGLDFNKFRRSNKRENIPLLTNRIVGGKKTDRFSGWPFQVSIQVMRTEPLSHICGGTLIHPLFILSAAHCFKGLTTATDYRFLLGFQDLRQGAQPEEGIEDVQVRYANSISLYPGGAAFRDIEDINYRHVDVSNDLALIELNAPIRMTPTVWPACLPHLSEPITVGRGCLASGFGDTRGTGQPYQLKQVEQIVAHSSNCDSVYSDFRVDDYTMICVRNKHANGPCNGDSGGPLFCADGPDNFPIPIDDYEHPAKNLKPGELIRYIPIISNGTSSGRANSNQPRYTIHGVTSFTTDGNFAGGFCGLENVPTIYSRTSTKVDWILSKIKMSMFRLGEADIQQDQSNRSALFGYMFRTGMSRHANFTRPMTVYATETGG